MLFRSFSSDEQDFTFRVVPTPNGKDVKIEHSIYQKSYNIKVILAEINALIKE